MSISKASGIITTMISYLITHQEVLTRVDKIQTILQDLNLSTNHPDVLWLGEESKQGMESARRIQQFLGLKPSQGQTQAVVILTSENLTLDAQNALLKTLEEPPAHATIILGSASQDQLLPTIISRCQLISLTDDSNQTPEVRQKLEAEVKKLIDLSIEKRFQYVEKLEEKERFLYALTSYFRQQLPSYKDFLKELVVAEKWAQANVNIRAILEYLMLKLPENDK